MAFSIAKVIIEIKDVGLLYLGETQPHRLDYYQIVGDNNDELAQRLEDTANRLVALERTIDTNKGIPKAAEEAMENFKSYVVFRAPT